MSPLHKCPCRLPVTPHILRLLFRVWSHPPVSQDRVMLWAACCTGFFGFLRSGEFTCEAKDYSNSVLSAADVGVDSRSNPSFVAVHLCHSKTDIFGVGATIYLGHVDGPICPVKALLAYLSLRGASPGPLFVFQDGSPLSRSRLSWRCELLWSLKGWMYADSMVTAFALGLLLLRRHVAWRTR